ncbi:MAG: SDR family NAD(P)-dependent oxidoreductase, partial [Nanoarchaeota archaeon]|nr:SDR family NAD(P)-dependent oxidoreductase [Nanoarchaeota archaeon]
LDRTIFITGASSGIGLATAKKFSQNGDKLILLARREDKLKALQYELESPVHYICADVSDLTSLKSGLSSLPEEFSNVDVLINNAGITLGEGVQWTPLVRQ